MSDFRQEALELVTSHGYKTVVETGVWRGELSKMLYEVVEQLILVDPWKVEHNRFAEYDCTMGEPFKTQDELDLMCEEVKNSLPNAKIMRMTSLEAVDAILDSTIDLVYIDSVHLYTYCKKEIVAWLPKIRPGGMIAGDDYIKEHNQVSKAVDEILGPQDTDRTWSKLCP
jgi:hypothetical protein